MNRDETKRIIYIIKTSYPNFNPEDITGAVDIWQMMLDEYSYDQVALALKTYIKTNTSGFAPSISQIVDNIHKMSEIGSEKSEMEAWEYVRKAVKNSGYNSAQEFEKLPEDIKKVVKSPDALRTWSQTDIQEFETVIQSNFMRSYRAQQIKAKEIKRMPEEAKRLVENSVKAIEEQ